MYFVFGKRMLGKCDQVPGFFHVATQFFHINFVPLIPLQTYIILSEDGNSFRGIPVGLSAKTVGLAWGRVGSFVAAIGLGIATMVEFNDRRASLESQLIIFFSAVAMALFFVFLMWHRVCTKASLNRAVELGQRLGLSVAAMAQLQQIYGESAGQGFTPIPVSQPAQSAPVMPRNMPVAMPTARPVAMPAPKPAPRPAPRPAAMAPAAEVYPCRVCRNRFGPDRCYTEADGRTICHSCWAAANSMPAQGT